MADPTHVTSLPVADRQFRLLAEAVPQLVWTADLNGACDYVNRRWSEYSGLTDEASLRLGWLLAVHPEDQDRLRAAWETVSQTSQTCEIEVRLRRTCGAHHWFLVRAEPFVEGGEAGRWFALATDIDEDHREGWFHSLADSAPVLIWMSGLAKEGVYFNRPWLEFTGAPLEKQVGDGWVDFVHPEDRARLLETCATAFRERRSFTSHCRLRRASGEYRWMLDTGTPRFDPDGTFAGFIGTCIDVTESRLAQEAIEENEQRLNIALRAGRMGVWAWDLGTNAVRWSPALEEIHGLTPGTFGGTFTDFERDIFPPDREVIHAAIEKAVRDRTPYRVKYRIVRPDGRVAWLESRGELLLDGRGVPRRLTGVSTDITDRMRTEHALLESENRFRTLADNIAPFAWMADENGDIFWYNRRWFDYTGTTLEEVRGWGWQKVHHPDHVERVVEKFRRHIMSGAPWEDTFPLRGADGTYRWFLSRAQPIRDEFGRVLRWLGTNTDITAQRDAEEVLKEADRRKDEFLATLAHELRNPLTPIRNALAILQLAGPGAVPRKGVLDMMERQVDHLVRLVEDLLEVSRITRGKIDLRCAPVRLETVLTSAVEISQPLIDAAGHELLIEVPADLPHLEADSFRLAQVVANLLNNAAKYTEPGGRIWLTARRDGSEILIAVRDNGVGISAEMLPRVFEMFTQVRQERARSQGGLGIGLTLVRSLVELHGGSVVARSDGLGQGSEFLIRLPITDLDSGHP